MVRHMNVFYVSAALRKAKTEKIREGEGESKHWRFCIYSSNEEK